MNLARALIIAMSVTASGAAIAAVDQPEQPASSPLLTSVARLAPELSAERAASPRTRQASRVHYCERWPSRCNVSGTCVAPAGCQPMIWACCSPGLGCWAVSAADACPDTADLYPFDCEAGESAVDPASGESIIICHD